MCVYLYTVYEYICIQVLLPFALLRLKNDTELVPERGEYLLPLPLKHQVFQSRIARVAMQTEYSALVPNNGIDEVMDQEDPDRPEVFKEMGPQQMVDVTTKKKGARTCHHFFRSSRLPCPAVFQPPRAGEGRTGDPGNIPAGAARVKCVFVEHRIAQQIEIGL